MSLKTPELILLEFGDAIIKDAPHKTPTHLTNALKALDRYYAEYHIGLLKDLPDKNTDCAEFYMHDSPADDGCDPIEHARRDGRFSMRMEIQDYLTERINQSKDNIAKGLK